MSELSRLFENAKVGDDVCSARLGWLKITRVSAGETYCIYTNDDSYTIAGKLYEDDKAPTLWPESQVPQYLLDLFPRPKKTIEGWLLVNANGKSSGFFYLKRPEPALVFTIPVRVTGEYEVEE